MALFGDGWIWSFWLPAGALIVVVAGLMIAGAAARARARRAGCRAMICRSTATSCARSSATSRRGVIAAEEAGAAAHRGVAPGAGGRPARCGPPVRRRRRRGRRASPSRRRSRCSVSARCWLYLPARRAGLSRPAASGPARAGARRCAADRPGQARGRGGGGREPPAPKPDPKYLALVEKLRAAVTTRPDDLTGHAAAGAERGAAGQLPTTPGRRRQRWCGSRAPRRRRRTMPIRPT